MASVSNVSMHPTFENQALGTVYGNCIGDAIGLLTEFMPKKECNQVRVMPMKPMLFNINLVTVVVFDNITIGHRKIKFCIFRCGNVDMLLFDMRSIMVKRLSLPVWSTT